MTGAIREPIDEHFLTQVRQLRPGTRAAADGDRVLALFDAQAQSRHLDLAARWLQAQGEGFYTIGSAGHEANAAVGLLTRVDDPALLHYRSGGFYAARAARVGTTTPVRDVLLGLSAAAADPISGGRHKVFGHPDLHIVPQTSTIASHLPRAVGLAYTLGNLADVVPAPRWPDDAIVVASLGDASVNHSTAQGALNAAAYLTHRGLDVPLLVVVEDNGIGISTRTPAGWVAATLRRLPGFEYVVAGSPRPDALLADVGAAVDLVREQRRPALLHLHTVRYLGHAGSDVELGYRTATEIARDHARDPLLATAAHLVETGVATPEDVLDRYERIRAMVMHEAKSVIGERRLENRGEVVRPLAQPSPVAVAPRRAADPVPSDGLTLAQAVNAALSEVLESRPHAVLFGEDVAVKGGVYGVTRGLRKRYGGRRVFDTLLDEQTILGTALGASLAGLLPIPEIQYLAYLHNAEDQLRGEAASLAFFSDGQYRNPMVVRVQGLGYQKGFGGHFHNDNSLAVLRDIPGIVLCVPSHPADVRPLLMECVELAELEGRVCVVVEPIALYHSRDLHEPGDGLWTADYLSGGPPRGPRAHGDGEGLLVVTFGNGVPMSLRAARRLEEEGIRSTVLDLRWLAPLPVDELAAYASSFERVLVVDETRRSGGVGEGVVAALVERGYAGRIGRVAAADSFVPLGPAAGLVLVSEDEVVAAALGLARG
ncbi:MFS transporter [Nocardioides sp. MAH-18]|uniref:MFS transporter n=1 Tax=Nocardioides agri TaxID=2682843 RepID=A0A6L6XPB6_9ACTN|nr:MULTISPECIES: thiamine pyrophosphate-dependent enzyme [unclassified Nocardioides]MBA2953703.1 MFS transporter [Nocardioides sp. CGMCC 1.13656]MVQ48567.1 MFS transporter [Nocardioides sp. MAH-18]